MINSYHDKLKQAIKGKTFVFIDAANLEKSVQDMYVNLKDVPGELMKYQPDFVISQIQELKSIVLEEKYVTYQ